MTFGPQFKIFWGFREREQITKTFFVQTLESSQSSQSFPKPSPGFKYNSIPLFDRESTTGLQADFQKMSLKLSLAGPGPDLAGDEAIPQNNISLLVNSRKLDDQSKPSQMLDEFNSGIVYDNNKKRRESYNSQSSLIQEPQKHIMEESPDRLVRSRRKSSGLERETKGIFSEKKSKPKDHSKSIFFTGKAAAPEPAVSQTKKLEVIYSRCMLTISNQFFSDFANDRTFLNNQNLLTCLVGVIAGISQGPHTPSLEVLRSAVDSVGLPASEWALTLLVFNMLTLAARFPFLESLILEKVLNFAIKLDCDLNPLAPSRSPFPAPHPLSAGSVFQASTLSFPKTVGGRSVHSRFRPSIHEKLSLFSKSPVNPGFSQEASSRLEVVLLLVAVFAKSRLQVDPNFANFFGDPQRNPVLHRFTEALRSALAQRLPERVHSSDKSARLGLLREDQRAFADLLISLVAKKVLRLKQPNLVQFLVFIAMSLKTPLINRHSSHNYLQEKFFERLILNVFSVSVHTPAKLASLNYIQGFLSNSRRVSAHFQFIVLDYLLKLTKYFFRKGWKSLRGSVSRELTQPQFAKFSKLKRSKILNCFSNPVLVRLILFQAKVFEASRRVLDSEQHSKLVKAHEEFLRKNRK